MKRVTLAAAILLTTAITHPISARFIDARSFEELFAKADFVVLAKPVMATRDTPERSELRDIHEPVIGVITEFETLLVLKGSKQKRFILHHYRLVPSDVALINGPTLLTFDPKEDHRPYLLFLVREQDGRFAPVASQTDLDVSVRQVAGIAE
jgi:hypothetical protein